MLGNYLAFDLEWDESKNNRIEAVSFVDNTGWSEVKLRDRDFGGSEIGLLDYIMDRLLNYPWSIGWHTQGSSTDSSDLKKCDLSILHERCEVNRIGTIIKKREKGMPYIAHSQLGHIDLYNVYRKVMVKDGMYHSVDC